MLKNIMNLEGVAVLSKEQQETVTGGVTRKEYCKTLGGMLNAYFATDGESGYQGDVSYGMSVFANNCGAYGYTIN